VDAIPESAQGVQGIAEDYVFFNVIRGTEKQFFDTGKDGLFRLLNQAGNLVLIGFKQRRVIENMPSKLRTGARRAHNSDPWIWMRRFQVSVWRPSV
jgi:hypothetical protein